MVQTFTRKNPLLLICIFLLALASLGTANYFWRLSESVTPLSAYSSQLDFPLYYPKGMSERLEVENIQTVGKASLSYRLKVSEVKRVTLSLQARPESLKIFRLDGFDQLTAPHGTLYVGAANGSATAILATEKTLVTMRGSKDIDISTLIAIGQALQPVQK